MQRKERRCGKRVRLFACRAEIGPHANGPVKLTDNPEAGRQIKREGGHVRRLDVEVDVRQVRFGSGPDDQFCRFAGQALSSRVPLTDEKAAEPSATL